MKDRTIVWCLRQKRGIRIVQPNENLTKAYLKKAISALNTMNAASEIGETDWITTTAYYARYFALYALLVKMGIKSEIHECSIAVASLLTEKGILRKDFHRHLKFEASQNRHSVLREKRNRSSMH